MLQNDHYCPSPEQLLGFSSGELSAMDFERVVQHLESCPVCESTVDQLVRSSSHILGDFLRPAADTPLVASPFGEAYQRMEAAALALCEPQTSLYHKDADPDCHDTAFEINESIGIIGPYRLIEVLGVGGMGIVYRAVHQVMRRTVALKTFTPNTAHHAETVTRFRVEAEAVARLRHPHIVEILHYDETDGLPYLVMEIVEGWKLSDLIRKGKIPEREAAEMTLVLAQAVAYAHDRHVVHRDIKPSNILIDREGRPKLADFGLAVLLDGATNLTRSGCVMGTPAYMAPEQILGRSKSVGPSADIYALGAVLYELLTGQPAYSEDGKTQLFNRILKGNFQNPSEIRPELSHDLVKICLKCLEYDVRDRYATAGHLIEDLQHWLQGEPIASHAPSLSRRISRTLRRNLRTVRFTGVSLGVIALAGGISMMPNRPITPTVVETNPNEFRTPGGRLLPFRMIEGQDKTKVTVAEDGAITVNTWGRCLVEYTGVVPPPPYRFAARVEHQRSDTSGQVGIYFARVTHDAANGRNHLFGKLHFNDIRSRRDLIAMSNLPKTIPAPDTNILRFETAFVVECPNQNQEGTCGLNVGPPFKVHGSANKHPRVVAVVIGRNNYWGEWENVQLSPVSLTRFQEGLNISIKNTARVVPNLIPRPTVHSDTGMGRFGFYITSGAATFNMLPLQPLTDEPVVDEPVKP